MRSFRWTCIVLGVSADLALATVAHAQPNEDWTAPPAPAPAPAPGAPAAAPAPVPPAPYDGRAAAPQDPWGGYPPPQLGQPMAAPAGPVVHLLSDNPVARLQVMNQLKWQNVCVAPCGLIVDPRARYRIGGGTVRPSEEFGMPRAAGAVHVSAQVGSTIKHWVGVGMLLGGLGAVAGGAILYNAGSSRQTDSFGNDTGDFNHALGVTYIVVGALVALIGLPLSLSHTTVDVQ